MSSTTIGGMTEEELLAQAIALSISEQEAKDAGVQVSTVPLTEKERKDKIRQERLAALEKRGIS